MKYILIFCLVALFAHNAAAQQSIGEALKKRANPEAPVLPTREVVRHIGEDVYIYDHIWGQKLVNDTLRLLYVGGLYPHHLVTILIKGKQAIHDLSFLQEGKASHFSGRVVMYEGKPAILLLNSIQTGTRIQI